MSRALEVLYSKKEMKFVTYSISGHQSITAGPVKSASTAPYKNKSHKWDS